MQFLFQILITRLYRFVENGQMISRVSYKYCGWEDKSEYILLCLGKRGERIIVQKIVGYITLEKP